ncbi:ABC transporter substrate-binding protein [Nocardiopsis sp. HNM0947]|uniref:ABC transporter substrate-binding protein n=1 Tax=Nocardiopsis coralli TaxID=2772213 RepID=A0ABR9PAI8_9ACTN|nr:ABC transporter substrate-binding protein [Nocardiopsis coralli]MBE3000848.1 ABC transporter substrate-binding protein [Nocardiopsis coralli]
MLKRLTAVAACAALLATGCSGSPSGEQGEGGQVTFALPFAGCLAWYPLYVAEENGYFEDEGIDAEFQATDGSGGAVQATLSGQAQLAATAPDAYLEASGAGADLEAFYGLYQRSTFSVVVPEGSPATDLSDLEGSTVGISTPGGGDVVYSEWLLATEAGLTAEEDYQQLAVGEGSSAATALSDGSVDAFAATYVDEEVISSGELDINVFTSEEAPDVVDNLLASTTEWAQQNPEQVEGVGRALARGTAWGLENRDGVVDLCGTHAPEEVQDPEFAEAIHGRVSELFELPESADGQYGHIDTGEFTDYAEELAELGLVASADGAENVHNDHVEAWNEDPAQ